MKLKRAITKRSIIIAGHKTSVSVEADFWEGLREIAKERRVLVSAGLAIPLAIGRSGARAWWIVPQARQPYLGRRMRSTRRRAGTMSSISLTVSPIVWSAPPQQGQT